MKTTFSVSVPTLCAMINSSRRDKCKMESPISHVASILILGVCYLYKHSY